MRALESDSDRACLYQGMKPGQSMEYDSQFGSEYGGGTNRYGVDSGQFDTEEYNAGIRSFKKPMLGTQQFGLPQIRSGEFGLPAIRSGEFALPHSSEYNAINITSSGEFDGDSGAELLGDESRIDVYTAPRSGQFSSNNSGNMQQAGRPDSRDSNTYTPPRSGQFAQSGGNSKSTTITTTTATEVGSLDSHRRDHPATSRPLSAASTSRLARPSSSPRASSRIDQS